MQLKPITVGPVSRSPSSGSGLDLIRTQIAVEGTMPETESCADNSTTMANGGYNPFVTTEGDTVPSDKATADNRPTQKNSASSNVTDKMKSSVAAVKNMAVKAKDFTKSSIAKVNNLPVDQTQKAIDDKISKAKNEPRELSKLTSDGLKGAGKGVALVGLGILSLPLAAAAIVANRHRNIGLMKAGANDLEGQMLKIKAELEKADRDGDLDKKADLLILQRQTEKAFMKLKYGISKPITRRIDEGN